MHCRAITACVPIFMRCLSLAACCTQLPRAGSSIGRDSRAPVKDNFECRLILLRHRLTTEVPDLQIVSTGRGRFALRADAALELVER